MQKWVTPDSETEARVQAFVLDLFCPKCQKQPVQAWFKEEGVRLATIQSPLTAQIHANHSRVD